MNEIFENPILIGLIGGVAVIGCGYVGLKTGKRSPFVIGAIALLATLALLLLSLSIETDREQIRTALFELENAVQTNNVEAVLSHIHSRAPDIKQSARQEMERHTFRTVDIKRNLEITIQEDQSPRQAEATFNVEVQGDFDRGRLPNSRGIVWVVLQFQKDTDEKWRVTHYHYDRITEGLRKRND